MFCVVSSLLLITRVYYSLSIVRVNGIVFCLLRTHAQRCVHVIFCRCIFYIFFMAALVGQTAERIFTKL